MFSVVICTLGQRINELKKNLYSIKSQDFPSQVIVVSQGNHDEVKNVIIEVDLDCVHVINKGKGLSVARNIAMEYVKGDYLLFADDDNWYKEGIFKLIENKVKSCDVCCFQYFDIENNVAPKSYKHTRISSMSYLQLLKVSSIEIVINLRRVGKENILFNENFGLGTENKSGEENLLLTSLKRKGYKISYEPIIISYHPAKQKTSNIKIYNSSYFITKKHLFRAMYGRFWGDFVFGIFYFKKKVSSLLK